MNLNGRTINPGEMRTKVTLEPRTVTTGSGGFQVPGQGTGVVVWSKWTNAHGSEVWQADAVQAERAATVLIRYRTGIDETYTILKGSDRYQIVSMDNIGERGEWIELKVKAWRPG